ncbi:hypothetical protein JCM3770_000153 [Rhodotorula araucariae]
MGLDLSRGRLKPDLTVEAKGRQRSPLSHERSTGPRAFAGSPPPPRASLAPPHRSARKPQQLELRSAGTAVAPPLGQLRVALTPPLCGNPSPGSRPVPHRASADTRPPAQLESVGEAPRILATAGGFTGSSSDESDDDVVAMPPPRARAGGRGGSRRITQRSDHKEPAAAACPPEVLTTVPRRKPAVAPLASSGSGARFAAQVAAQEDYNLLDSQSMSQGRPDNDGDAPCPSQPLALDEGEGGGGGGGAGSSSPRFQSPGPLVVVDEDEEDRRKERGSYGGDTRVESSLQLEGDRSERRSEGSRDMSGEASPSPAPPKRGIAAIDEGDEDEEREARRRRVENEYNALPSSQRSGRSVSPASTARSRSFSLATDRGVSLAPSEFLQRTRSPSVERYVTPGLDFAPLPRSVSPSVGGEPVRPRPSLAAFYAHEQRPHLQFARAHAAQRAAAETVTETATGDGMGWDDERAVHEGRFVASCIRAGELIQTKAARGAGVEAELAAHEAKLAVTAQALRDSQARIWEWGMSLLGGKHAAVAGVDDVGESGTAEEGRNGAGGDGAVVEPAPLPVPAAVIECDAGVHA